MRIAYQSAVMVVLTALVFLGCSQSSSDPESPSANEVSVITIAAIPGVTPPVTGATPVTAITETDQYTGTVTWNGSPTTFAAYTGYTATITLQAKAGYTLTGVTADFFTVSGAAASNSAGSGIVTAVFPKTIANLAAVSDYTGTGVGTLKAVQGGTFNNGSANMTVSSFRMSQYEITRTQFLTVMGTDPSISERSSGISDPVQGIRWYHAIAFCNKLSLIEGLTPVYSVNGITDWINLVYASIPTTSNATWDEVTADWSANGYRLPTEAEWEFAARGGNVTHGYAYAGSNTIGEVAVFGALGSEAGRTTTETSSPVGGKTANELGIYDMSGNVTELCWDWDGTYPSTAQSDYRGVDSGTYRIMRGGSWANEPNRCTVSMRDNNSMPHKIVYTGFRVVRR